jgi:hypothetical protein
MEQIVNIGKSGLGAAKESAHIVISFGAVS